MQMDFKSILGENCKTGELLKEHTTFKVGGECDYFLTPVTEEELSRCMDIIKKEMPEYEKKYKELNFLDKLFGAKCPICKKLGGKKRG